MALTRRRQRFVEAYAGNATGAAIAAGYSEKTAYAQGHRLLKNVEVAQAIREREARAIRPAIANRSERQEFWTMALRNGDLPLTERLKASELLGKSEGDFLEKVKLEAKVEQNVEIDYAALSDEELLRYAGTHPGRAS